ncbi:ABC transporter permease [bacterium]|nr:ABC transporter permease [bacterium]
MKNIITLSVADFKLIFRDPSLRSFLGLPILLFALVIWLLPYLAQTYPGFEPYISVFMVVAAVENTQMFSFISSMVLIDEKENSVAQVYGVVPLSNSEYLLSRLAIPYLFTVCLNVILFIVQPFYHIGLIENISVSMLVGLIVPVYVIGINSIVKNRMQGMVYIKAFNLIVLAPIAAFFIPGKWEWIFGLLPSHWVFQSIQNLTNGEEVWMNLLIGFVFLMIMFLLLSRHFLKKHFN